MRRGKEERGEGGRRHVRKKAVRVSRIFYNSNRAMGLPKPSLIFRAEAGLTDSMFTEHTPANETTHNSTLAGARRLAAL